MARQKKNNKKLYSSCADCKLWHRLHQTLGLCRSKKQLDFYGPDNMYTHPAWWCDDIQVKPKLITVKETQ